MVGVSQYCTYPPEALKLPRIGGWQTSSIEKIVALHPDLVVLTEAQTPFIADGLRAFHIPFLAPPSESLADVFTSVDRIGAATGNQEQASHLAARIRAKLDAIRSATANLPKRTVLLNISRTPGTLSDLYVATQGSYLIDLIDIAGGRSVTAPERSGYGKISKEAIVAANPDFIIDLVHTADSKLSENSLEVWNDLPEVAAVRNKHVYMVDDPFVIHPSQFVAHTAEIFLHILHPEVHLH